MEASDQKNPATSPIRLLLVGPKMNDGLPHSDVVGGTVVLFAETVRQLKKRGFALHVLNTWRARTNLPRWRAWANDLVTFLMTMWGVVSGARRAQLVFLNMSTFFALVIVGPCVWLICRLVRRPLVLRFFGGRFHRNYEAYSPITRWIADMTFLRSEIVYVETRQTVLSFPTRGNFRWHPNTRDVRPSGRFRRVQARNLIFIGQLRMAKGLLEALQACRILPPGCHLHVFGPEMPDTDFTLFEGHPRASYCGVANPTNVPDIICQQDLLLFPSYLAGEGYPGVIIEAFQCQVPVIASRLPSVQEIVRHEHNGLLVEPRSVAELEDAIVRVLEHPDLYKRLVEGAKQTGEFFRSGPWFDKMAADIEFLARESREG